MSIWKIWRSNCCKHLTLLCQILCKTIVLLLSRKPFQGYFWSSFKVEQTYSQHKSNVKLETLWYVNNGENALKIHYSHNGIFLGSSLKLSNSWTNANIFFRGKKEEKTLLLYKHCLCVCERTISETYLYWIAFLWKKNEPLGNI